MHIPQIPYAPSWAGQLSEREIRECFVCAFEQLPPEQQAILHEQLSYISQAGIINLGQRGALMLLGGLALYLAQPEPYEHDDPYPN